MKSIPFVLLFLASVGADGQVSGCACLPPCSAYTFTNNLTCDIQIRWTILNTSGTQCTWQFATVNAGNTVCLITCIDFFGCTGPPYDVIITLNTIDGNTIPTGTPNTIDHSGTIGTTTGTQTAPTNTCGTTTFNLSAVNVCGSWIN